MKKGFSFKLVLIGLAVVIPLALLVNYLWQPTGVVRGKSSATPLTSEMTPEQQLAQELALSDPRVLDYTAGKRAEVFGVRTVGNHYPASSSACGTAECRQVEIYIFNEHAAVTALVNVTGEEVLDVFYQPGVHPGLNKRLADLALEIAINSQEVIDALGFRPTKADMAPVESGLVGTACDTGHLCVGPTFEMGDRILWAIVDLTDEKLAGLNFTRMEPNPPNNAVLFEPEGCPTPGSVNRDGWLMDYEVTGTDGLRIYNVSYNGVTVMTSAKAIEWHADYGASGYTDYTGCGGGGGGFHINPYGETEIKDMADGFEVVQDFRMNSWGNYCNYRYEQHFQFFNDGRFRVVGGAYGKGCGENAIYRPLIRIDVAVAGDDDDTFAVWDGTGWWDQATENWWSQAAPYTPEGYKWRVMDGSGAGYYMEPGQDNNFGDLGRGDDAFIYVTQHHPSEGDTDLGIIGACCNDNYMQGPHIYLNNESIASENVVVWYVPQFVTDPSDNDGDGYYCWTIVGEPHPETYPCFGGPMFVPMGEQSPAADIAVDPPSLSATLASGDSVVETFTISNNGQEDLNWFVSEEGANDGPLSLSLVPYVSGLDEPVNIAHAGDGRLFIVEKDGFIRIIDENGNLLPAPFLDIDSLVGSGGSEQGLLGLAFHPDFANNGYFYVNYTNNSGNTTISRFNVVNEGSQANPGSELILLVINQPYSNHNGGDLHFGSDGYLYIGMGDGGSAGDPGNRAQNPQNLLGKMLRIDVDSGNPYGIPSDNPFVNDPNTLDEIWALGTRNPWRFGFDRITNDLFIGDVGQNNWEEIDFQPASSGGGENYGWRCYEGTHAYNTTGCQPYDAYDAPIFEYSHGSGCSVSGGYRYWGADYPAMVGHYLLADYCSGSFWSLIADGNGGWNSYSYPGATGFGIVSFGEDNSGELYAANISNGTIYRVTETSGADGISWASVSPVSGVTPGGQSAEVSVTFDATGLAAGTYNANLIITSNDPDTPEIVYPLTLTVTGGQTMRSAGIGLWGQQVGSFVVARGVVLVRDNNNAAVPGADVYVTWTKPNGSTTDQVGTTAANGTVWFQTGSLVTGMYTITVTDIVKAGYIFDPNNSVLSKTITIP